ncbi:sugar phosphate isomerase/epimerase [Candidatus Pacearchaeota archaeon]|nr:sugar phosphate isomerase/epimerase [Candidatus Pacearchaeota archaeon]
MVGDENFYAGADYGLDPNFQNEFSVGFNEGYRTPAATIGLTLDGRTANQITDLFKKLGTGAKTFEIQGTMPEVLDSIPKQHFTEINRLKKLTGIDLTFHGPLVEPTGIGQQGNWDPAMREQAETRIWSAVERAQKLEPDGNVIVTLHSSNGLPEPRSRIKTDDGRVIDSNLAVIDERTGRFGVLPKTGKDFLTGEVSSVDTELKKLNERNWSTELSNVNISASRGRDVFANVEVEEGEEKEKFLKHYRDYVNGTLKDKDLENMGAWGKEAKHKFDYLSYGDIFVRDSYNGFKNLFNEAYGAVQKSGSTEDLAKLDKLKEEILPIINEYGKDPTKVIEIGNAVERGIRVLDSIAPPKIFTPIKEFAVDKASETFSNVALKSYKKFGEHSPILSIENPPAGMGMSRAEDIRDLIIASRKKFAEKLVEKEGMSLDSAKKQAEKLIGATWDVGHINMIRASGYSESDVVAEAKKIAPFVKHVHLSDNFGLEHTELPMGMGNVPMKKILKLSENFKKAKKIIEGAAGWYQHFQTSPLAKTMSAFGSPIYSMQMAPYWNQAAGATGGYWAGQGQTLPEQHFNMYGAGFSTLPVELGGQMSGKSRVSGAPME